MADEYVDYDGGSDAASGADWANALDTVNAGAIDTQSAGAGDKVYVKTDASGTATETVASQVNFPLAHADCLQIYGCKNATTAEPPVNADLTTRGDADIPAMVQAASMQIDGFATIHGMRIAVSAGGSLQLTDFTQEYVDCELEYDAAFLATASDEGAILRNCELIHVDTASGFSFKSGSSIEIVGGICTNDTDNFIESYDGGTYNIYGLDISPVNGTIVANADNAVGHVRLVNCKLNATHTLHGTGNGPFKPGFVEIIGCSSATKGAAASFIDYFRSDQCGTCTDEGTGVRTGGANDGATGAWAYALTPGIDKTRESTFLGVQTPWMIRRVAGDASTAKTFTVYIANDSGADLNDDDVWCEWLTPAEDGGADHDYDMSSRNFLDTPAVVTDDAASTWTSPAANGQKFSITKTPDFTGTVRARVHFCKRYAATPKTVYVDPKIDIA